jgi:hypothetical protein
MSDIDASRCKLKVNFAARSAAASNVRKFHLLFSCSPKNHCPASFFLQIDAGSLIIGPAQTPDGFRIDPIEAGDLFFVGLAATVVTIYVTRLARQAVPDAETEAQRQARSE